MGMGKDHTVGGDGSRKKKGRKKNKRKAISAFADCNESFQIDMEKSERKLSKDMTRKKEKKKTECSHENMMGSYEFDLNKKRKIKKRDRSKNENIDTHPEIIYGSEENIVRSSESHVGNQSLGHYDQLAKQKDEADKERKRRKKKNKEQNKTECTHGNITG